jgi:predicted aspartyl protease
MRSLRAVAFSRLLFLVRPLGLMLPLGWIGCATSPYSQLETTSPALSPAQVAELQKTAKKPEELGFQMRVTERSVDFAGVNTVEAKASAIVPLLEVPAETQPASAYRVPVVPATVNGKPGARVLLDSGSNRNLFGYTLARSLDIPVIAGLKPIQGMGIGGAIDDYVAVVPSMQIGSVELRNLIAVIGPDAQVLSFTRGFRGDQQVMILGVNALRRLSFLTIDNLRGTVIFGGTEAFLPDDTLQSMTTAPLHWVNDLPAVDVSVDGRDPVECILDTGGDYGMLVPRTQAIELGYWKPGKGELTTSRGVGGASLATSYLVKRAKVGDTMLERIPAHTTVVGPEPGGGRLLLGNVMLRRYRVTFDFQHGVLWLER